MVCTGAAGATQAQGGPPLETDDPGTPGPGHVELNLSVEAEWEGTRTFYDLPRLDANLGVGSRVQLKIEVPRRVASEPGGPTEMGVGNVGLGIKWRFVQTGAVAISTYPQLALSASESAGTKGLADTGTTFLMPIEVAWDAGWVSLNAEVGYEHGQGTSELVYGLALAYEARPSLELLGECHGSGNIDFTRRGALCGVGLRWELHPMVSLLAAYATGVMGSVADRPDHRLYSGVQLRW